MVLTRRQAANIQKMQGVEVDSQTGRFLNKDGNWEKVPFRWVTDEFVHYTTQQDEADFPARVQVIIEEAARIRGISKKMILRDLVEFANKYDQQQRELEERIIP